MCFGDHPPPRFHVVSGGYITSIRCASPELDAIFADYS
jgi:hypothetical protein